MKTSYWLLLGLLVAGITWTYVYRVQRPWEYRENVEHGTLKAQWGDLYSPWTGTRDLLLYGRNPYGPEVTREIQMAFYGHIVIPSNETPDKAKQPVVDEQRFVYPVYVVFLLAPFLHSSFAGAQAWIWMILVVLTTASVLVWLQVLRWHPPKTVAVALVLFVLSSPQTVQGLQLRQLGLLVGFLLAVATWCVARNHLASAGAVFAIATIKPQMIALPLLWFLLWMVSDWRKRWHFLVGFSSVLAVLVGAGELILPRWPRYFLEGLAPYRRYTFQLSFLEIALGSRVGMVCAGILLAGLLAFAWRNRKKAGDSQEFPLTLALVFLGTLLTMPLVPVFNQVMLILPVLVILRDWVTIRHFVRPAFVLTVGWPWLASLVLLLVFPPQSSSLAHLYLAPSYVTLITPFILPCLFLMRNRNTNKNASSPQPREARLQS